VHARQVKRLLITDAMVIPGPATPAYGPVDILVQEVKDMVSKARAARRQGGDRRRKTAF